MAKLYLGDSQGAPAIVKVEEVPKTKFGASIDSFLGDVDENGVYSPPENKPYSVDFTSVKTIGYYGLASRFVRDKNLQSFIAPDLVNLDRYAFYRCFEYIQQNLYVEIGCETLNIGYECGNMFYTTGNVTAVFNKLIRISGNSTFYDMFGTKQSSPYATKPQEFDKIFPVLEYIKGDNVFNGFAQHALDNQIKSDTLKEIVGATTSKYIATFYSSSSASKTKYYFKSLTKITGYVFYDAAEIHFAAANQAAIEACDGYDEKWGATNATIYFDL